MNQRIIELKSKLNSPLGDRAASLTYQELRELCLLLQDYKSPEEVATMVAASLNENVKLLNALKTSKEALEKSDLFLCDYLKDVTHPGVSRMVGDNYTALAAIKKVLP